MLKIKKEPIIPFHHNQPYFVYDATSVKEYLQDLYNIHYDLKMKILIEDIAEAFDVNLVKDNVVLPSNKIKEFLEPL